jgi:hypothetical protein
VQIGGQLAQPYYASPYASPYARLYNPLINRKNVVENLTKKEDDKSDLTYYVEIDMELQRGKEPLTGQQMRSLQCNQKWNSVRRAYAEFTGRKYVIPPVYENIRQKEQTQNNTTQREKTGGKKRKTIKRR